MADRIRRSRWSWELGTLFGISLRIHVTLLALLAWIIIASPLGGGGVARGLADVAMVAAVFAIVVIHELAHALVARRFGSTTREILLLPIGGIANIDRIPERPSQELLVAIAGPAVNVLLALVFAVVLALAGADFFPGPVADLATFGAQLMWINLTLAAFNLIPAFPMDGGRVFRALLAMQVGRARATRMAAKLGRIIGVGFMLFGVLYNPMLVVIGLFVWFIAQQELASITLRSLLGRATVGDAMIHDVDPVAASDDPRDVADRMLAHGVRHLPVIDDSGRLAGVITATELASRLTGPDPHEPIRGVTREVPVVTPSSLLVDTLDAFDRDDVLLVVDDGALVGLLTLDQLATFADLQDERPPVPVARTMAIAGLLLILVACGSHSPSSAPTPVDRGSMTGERERGMANCPSALSGAKTEVANTPEGVDVEITAPDEATRVRIRELAERLAAEGPPTPEREVHTGQHGGPGTIGHCPIIQAGTAITLVQRPAGVLLRVHALEAAHVRSVQDETAQRLAHLRTH